MHLPMSPHANCSDAAPRTVLLLGANELDCELLSWWCASRIDGYQVDAKHNFEDGLERCRQLPPGLVVLDPLITDNASRVR